MKFFEKILPPKNKVFYDCFENAASVCNEMALLYLNTVENGINEEIVIKARSLKHRSVDIEKQTINLLNATFVTPIDREDIQELSCMLNKITKKIVQACTNLNVYRLENYTLEMKQQAKALTTATSELIVCVGLIKNIAKTTEITNSRNRMKEIETFGDDIMYKAVDELFSGKFDALEVIKLRDIYKDIESALDKCFSVSDETLNLALKNN